MESYGHEFNGAGRERDRARTCALVKALFIRNLDQFMHMKICCLVRISELKDEMLMAGRQLNH